MASKGRKAIKITAFIILLLAVGGFLVNWYLTYRLESKLREVLSEEVSKATDGFYDFSFDGLKIGLFSGELSIKGIEFHPDSTVFTTWQKGDSLPNYYYDIHVGEIHFRGVNLTWLLDYRRLNFSLFEIKSPDIKIVSPREIVNKEKPTPNKELGSLYELVSPYIDVLTVTRINLDSANVSYTVEDPVSPVIYALRNFSFKAYDFRLDENSSVSGKLLYSDNFEFVANESQELLHSDQIILNTDNIKLSTIESLIKIEGVKISPKDSLWEQRNTIPGEYLKTKIKQVEVNGVSFKRVEGKNYLDAGSFDILSTNIQYASVKEKLQPQENKRVADTVQSQPWSLYSILSPILNSVTIDKINIEKTRFDYTLTRDGYTDVYTLEQFDFHANEFRVDSLSETQKKFWYVDNFILTGSNINGLMTSNNANVSVEGLLLNTLDKKFKISNIAIRPLNMGYDEDYLSGGVRSINIEGLDYNTGVSADELKVESANINYYKIRDSQKTERPSKAEKAKIKENIFDFFTPYADFLSVKRISLTDANVIVHDRRFGEMYSLRGFNFYATKFLVDEHTKSTSQFLFTFGDVGLSFKDFDNLMPGGDYRLQVKNGNISSLSGRISLRELKLIPQENKNGETPSVRYTLETPLLEIKGFNYNSYLKDKSIELNSLRLETPDISVVKVRASNNPQIGKNRDLSSVFTHLKIDTLEIGKSNISYVDNVMKDSLLFRTDGISLNALRWDVKKALNLQRFVMQSPYINYVKGGQGRVQSPSFNIDEFASTVNIGEFLISDLELAVKQPDVLLKTRLNQFGVSGFAWTFQNRKLHLNISSIRLQEPYVSIDEKKDRDKSPAGIQKRDSSRTDFYSLLSPYVNTLSVNNFDIVDATIDYNRSLDGKEIKHQVINTTNLSIDKLQLNTDGKKFDVDDVRFSTRDLHFPVMDGFYTMEIGNIDVRKKEGLLALTGLHLNPIYPKTEFAHKHPKHKDWFDVTAGSVILSEVDFPSYLSDNLLKAGKLKVQDVMLQNYKNQKIEIEHNIMPLIYEKIHELPVRLVVDSLDVRNFSVLYEEMPKKGNESGKIYFDGMNGKIANFTNVPSYQNQYMILYADGKFMKEGGFTAKWYIPVSPDYDCFILEANVQSFDLKSLNPIFYPLARAEISRGVLDEFSFRTEASSKEANAYMKFLYSDLKVGIFKGNEGRGQNKFINNIANTLIKSNNPNRGENKPREAAIYIERDPYHSTFNYFWQILRPALAESAGVSQKEQNFAKKVAGFFSKVKNFFKGKKEDEKPVNKQ